jgi:hypothetical protein
MSAQPSAELIAGAGIQGDRYAIGTDTGTYSEFPDVREVTLIEMETLEALARDHDIELQAIEHRRNLTTRDVPLNHLVGRLVLGRTGVIGRRQVEHAVPISGYDHPKNGLRSAGASIWSQLQNCQKWHNHTR